MSRKKAEKKTKGRLLKRELPEIFNFEDFGDTLEGRFLGVRGNGAFRTLLFEDQKGKKTGVWIKAALEQVLDQMTEGSMYSLEYVADIKTQAGRRVKDIEVRELF